MVGIGESKESSWFFCFLRVVLILDACSIARGMILIPKKL